jgi:hypothetical protein
MFPAAVIPFALVAFFVGMVALAITLGRRQQRKTLELLAALAERLHLELRRQPAKFGFEPAPTVAGRHRDRQVRFFTYTTGSGKNRTTWCAVAAAIAGAPGLTLELWPENFVFRIATALGMQDIPVGDPEFDRAFIVKSNDPAYAAAALLPEIRRRLLDERPRGVYGRLVIKDGEVAYAENGGFDQAAKVDRFARMLEAACDLAEVAEVYQRSA